LQLTATARLCNKSPSALLGIEDEGIALAFDVECADLWQKLEDERETARLSNVIAAMWGTAKPKVEIRKVREQSF
jgi:hypothetical protein